MRYAYIPGGRPEGIGELTGFAVWAAEKSSCLGCGCRILAPDLYGEGEAICRSCWWDQRLAQPEVYDWALLELHGEIDVYDLLELETSGADVMGRLSEASLRR